MEKFPTQTINDIYHNLQYYHKRVIEEHCERQVIFNIRPTKFFPNGLICSFPGDTTLLKWDNKKCSIVINIILSMNDEQLKTTAEEIHTHLINSLK